ncbi:bifunctional 2',3'-cyclic-nucleotide 2'-phosphodiesterase/3'-nucleotidase [Vibrio sp. SS-MA-C1-2]|uniref:bifunctional 2',3'-cyclic-nucleotide 2'-phosphodiesterase/3'-nucleotidase n=1 Tax=Vibrio sp. SS-MA-C1-2 TaxID=2908646 RepID=UPI001F17F710|nr:bifunctional 2',3'-cyclic-nucleotide 2'-phosphodiesterase/3'-nucleotidase [Vibrio sp. SS-MA-C1-2]UJF17842.1 bifunctional 2',3'-cyclic-nucleotide 2'-phosphodiesterase/3'-nucleotidase [Vibrio sp. SS-MA-C1-2]
MKPTLLTVKNKQSRLTRYLTTFLLTLSLVSPVIFAQQSPTVDLRIIETSDIHMNFMDYDYYKNKPTERFGYARTVTLIKNARKASKNNLLVDNGDLLQGSPMGDWAADRGLDHGEKFPAYQAMNPMHYDVGNLGNHDFNYGLKYQLQATSQANFPYINANVYLDNGHGEAGKHAYNPYIIENKTVIDNDGNKQTIKVGFIGFVPPQIMLWDAKNLKGKVVVKDIVDTAKQYIPEMREKGADLIIAIPHSGLNDDPYHELMENEVYYLSKVSGIDGILFGHAHAVFPSSDFAHIPGADLKNGLLNGIPSVMPGRYGDHIGILDYKLQLNNDHQWSIIDQRGSTNAIYDKRDNKALVRADKETQQILKEDHLETIKYLNKTIGKSNSEINSYLAFVQDDPSIQIVNNAQTDYVKTVLKNNKTLNQLPVLSAAAPFKVGGRKNDPSSYTAMPKGILTFRNASDLYLYPNILIVVKATGAEVSDWLECSVGMFNQIDPQSTQPQSLINWNHRSYNYDVIDGISYQVDVTKPARFDDNCQLSNKNSHRVVNLTYQGKAVDPKQEFLVVTNNYRAFGGGHFAGTGKDHIVFSAPDQNRQVLTNYIESQSKKNGYVDVKIDNNWRLQPINSEKKLDIQFESSPSDNAKRYIKSHSVNSTEFITTDNIGFGIYRLNITNR